MRVNRILPYKFMYHVPTGRVASCRGAVPWTNETDKANWRLSEKGYTWEVVDARGNITYGLCRVPANTFMEALEVAKRINGSYDNLNTDCFKCGTKVDNFVYRVRHGHCTACHEKMGKAK